MRDTQVVVAYLHVLFSVHLFLVGDFAASASHLSQEAALRYIH